ncbi:hypothetical protein JZ751_000174, partial [Albula glossodonta]
MSIVAQLQLCLHDCVKVVLRNVIELSYVNSRTLCVFPSVLYSLRTCCTRLPKRRREGTRRSVSCRAPTLTSWMSSVQDATKSPPCSAMRRPWCCVWAAPQCCASPPVGRHASQKDARSGESSTSCSSTLQLEGRGKVGLVPKIFSDPAPPWLSDDPEELHRDLCERCSSPLSGLETEPVSTHQTITGTPLLQPAPLNKICSFFVKN